MQRVLVTEPLAERGLDLLREEFEVDLRPELASSGLAEAIAPYHALVVRSQTKVTAEVLERADSLKVVGRAGIGLDNVDVEAATRRGVVVVNAPQSNIVSAAEHAIALLLAQARNIPQADAALKAGRWERSRFQGVELYGKTLGVVGLGRVGTIVAQRALAFGMRVVAYDPFVSRERAKELGVDVVPSLEGLLVQADFISIHLPRTAETEGLIGEREIALMKEGVRIVNTARGRIVDERALVNALRDGRIGGVALDVFAEEPPPRAHPLFVLDNVVVTPHLGASTVEAQDKAGISVAEMVRFALRGEFVPYAVNVPAGEVTEQLRPFLSLSERLGALLIGLADGPIRGIEAEYRGRIAEQDTRILTVAALKGALHRVVHEPVSLVNAPLLAQERGIAVSERTSTEAEDFVNLVALRADTEAGDVAVAGTVVGRREGGARLVRVYDFDIDMPFARSMAFFVYEDRPGVIGTVGTMLGEAGVNIASMDVGRRQAGGLALMGLTVDSPIPPETLADIERAIESRRARALELSG